MLCFTKRTHWMCLCCCKYSSGISPEHRGLSQSVLSLLLIAMRGIMCILLVSVSCCSIGRQLISNETLQVNFNMWREFLRLLKLFSFQTEAPFWMTWRTLGMAEVHTLVNLHHTLQHYYHSVCVCVCVCCQSIREGVYFHMTENKCLVKMEMWLMADPSSPGLLLSHVWCLYIVITWIYRLMPSLHLSGM